MFRRTHCTTFLLAFALLSSARGGALKIDSLLTAALQGSNDYLVYNVAVESVALLTPVVEIGWALRQGYLGRADSYAAETSRLAAGALLLTQGVAFALKYTIRRERPARDYRPQLWNTRITPSFPSGHAASSAALATVVAGRYPRSAPAAAAYALASAYCQVYVGNHYVGDVLAGVVVGAMAGRWMLSRADGSNGAGEASHNLALPLLFLSLPLDWR